MKNKKKKKMTKKEKDQYAKEFLQGLALSAGILGGIKLLGK